jgi:TatD DNase family protein
LFDAHNHLQDERLSDVSQIMDACRREGLTAMVVNGSCEQDWPIVSDLSGRFPEVIPSFGYHPWHLHERTANWVNELNCWLDKTHGAVGEIGLDRWKPGLSYAAQEDAFLVQMAIAEERDVPASIHCLEAWGRLFDLLREHPRPACGFLLHSYSGSHEMIAPLAKLGAYFSFPGYYASERKQRQQEAFRHVPPDRLLVETDAPDQLLPPEKTAHPLLGADGKPLNHPANIGAVYSALAEILGEERQELASRVEKNFARLFGNVAHAHRPGRASVPASPIWENQ